MKFFIEFIEFIETYWEQLLTNLLLIYGGMFYSYIMYRRKLRDLQKENDRLRNENYLLIHRLEQKEKE